MPVVADVVEVLALWLALGFILALYTPGWLGQGITGALTGAASVLTAVNAAPGNAAAVVIWLTGAAVLGWALTPILTDPLQSFTSELRARIRTPTFLAILPDRGCGSSG